MTEHVFGAGYASLYDATYRLKDYAAETRLLAETFARYALQPVEHVLDLGCGTGNHAIELAARGFRVTAVDRSSEMLRQAQAKLQHAGPAVQWLQSDLRELSIAGVSDAAVLMFAVIGYFPANADLLRVLGRIRNSLREGGLLAFDCWYGPAVMANGPERRVAEIATDNGVARRAVTPILDERHQTCDVVYEIDVPNATAITERHRMRYFFPMELELLLGVCGYEMLSLTAFPSLERPADRTTWNVYCVARAGASFHSNSGEIMPGGV